jgi:acetyl-CoA synthetase
MFEGIPTWPDAGRFWEIIDKYKVNILYTSAYRYPEPDGFWIGSP